MAMGKQDDRERTWLTDRQVEVAGHIETGGALEINLFYCILVEFEPTMADSIQRSSRRHRPQTLGDEDPLAYLFGPSLPGFDRGGGGEEKIAVVVENRFQSRVRRLLARLQCAMIFCPHPAEWSEAKLKENAS